MEHHFDEDEIPTCFSLFPREDNSNKMAIGFMDGAISMVEVDTKKKKVEDLWSGKQKRSIRALLFSPEGETLYSLGQNRGLCSYDVETGRRTRVIRESHDDKPMCICTLPPSATKGQMFATADESGQIRTWDWRQKEPIICTFDNQEESINALVMDKNTLLAASSDGTLGAYEVRKRKLLMCSELMHSELLCIAVSDKFTYVGGRDGRVEVFNKGEYGNLLERIESGHKKGVSSILQLRRGLLLTAYEEEDEIRLLHTEPNRRLGVAVRHSEGVDQLGLTADQGSIVSLASFGQSLRFYPLKKILDKVPIIQATSVPKKKSEKENKVEESFFDDLVEQSKELGGEDDEESEDEEEEDSDVEEEEDGETDDEDNEEEEEEGVENRENGEAEGEEDDDNEEEEEEEEEGEGDDEEESGSEEDEQVQASYGKRRRLN